jgi:hypothetical protein
MTLAERIKSHLNGCADDVFDHKVIVADVQQQDDAFEIVFQDLSAGLDGAARVSWARPVESDAQFDELALAAIEAVASQARDFDDGD